jgi:hypothetical protein
MNSVKKLITVEDKNSESASGNKFKIKKIKIMENKNSPDSNQNQIHKTNFTSSKNISFIHSKSKSTTIPNLKTITSNSSSNNLYLLTFPNIDKPPSNNDKNFNFTTFNLQKRKVNNRNYSMSNNKTLSTEASKNFIEEINKLREKYLHNFHDKYLSSANNLKTYLNEFYENNAKSSKISYTQNEKIFHKIHTDTNTIFKNYFAGIMNKYNKEKKEEENLEQEPVEIKLIILDELEHSLPEYSKLITKLRKALTNIEKRKVVVNFKNLELGEKLDYLISLNKSKLSWDFSHIKINCLPMEFQRKVLRNEDFFDNLLRKFKKFAKKKKKIIESDEDENDKAIKAKFKSVGRAKVLVIPKEMKKDEEIYDDTKVFKIEEIRNEVKEMLSPNATNLKVKKFYDNLAIPKNKSPSHSKKELPARERILSDYEKFERNNMKLVNQIKSLKKKFKLKSLYVDPKWAIEELKS